jgi:hypothetical protein
MLVALWYLLPLAVLLTAGLWARRHLPGIVTGPRLAAFALFAIVVDVGLLRTPYSARAVDAVVLPSILCGCCVAALWRAGPAGRRGRVLRLAAIGIASVVVVTLAGAAQFGERASWLAGGWTSLERARGAWRHVHDQLMASPPLRFYVDRAAGSSLRLAAYVRACVPESERVLVLWFEPEIYYYSDRRIAQRHLVFVPEWAGFEHEQRLSMSKLRRTVPPIALARRSSLETQARASYPGVVEYVENEYNLAGTLNNDGEEFLIFARRDRMPVDRFGPDAWPCYVKGPSIWERVGRPRVPV